CIALISLTTIAHEIQKVTSDSSGPGTGGAPFRGGERKTPGFPRGLSRCERFNGTEIPADHVFSDLSVGLCIRSRVPLLRSRPRQLGPARSGRNDREGWARRDPS